jgi:hypothetical protein
MTALSAGGRARETKRTSTAEIVESATDLRRSRILGELGALCGKTSLASGFGRTN